jgi:hypothetical protein
MNAKTNIKLNAKLKFPAPVFGSFSIKYVATAFLTVSGSIAAG